jgi:Co/Zn/Cd efflux system component
VLLDREQENPVAKAVQNVVERQAGWESTSITDLHVWRVGRQTYACILSLVTDRAELNAVTVKTLLQSVPQLGHITVEIIHRRALTALD